MKSQRLRILSHLRRRPITALQALNLYGCLRLASRINDLRNQGHSILSTMVDIKGKRVARYSMGVK